jgi:uncharacterized protein YjbJ (UPF0337 family)
MAKEAYAGDGRSKSGVSTRFAAFPIAAFDLLNRKERKELVTVGDRAQRLKGKADEPAGKTKGAVGYETGSGKTEAKGAGQALKGKAQQAAGKARSTAKKKTR